MLWPPNQVACPAPLAKRHVPETLYPPSQATAFPAWPAPQAKTESPGPNIFLAISSSRNAADIAHPVP